MRITVGTFNLNNLFSRFNFELKANIEGLKEGTLRYSEIHKIVQSLNKKPVEYKGKALKHKADAERQLVAERIRAMNVDVLCVQEVEDIDTLRYFASKELGAELYPHLVLVEGNDARLLDLAVLSKYPLGAVTTWQHATHHTRPDERVFSRDLLQVDVLNSSRKERLFTIFNNHFKSHFVPFTEDQEEGVKAANELRRLQAETAALIIEQEMRPDSPFIVLGDMNDGVDSAFLRPLTDNLDLELFNGLANAQETREAPKSTSPPPHNIWTYRFKPSGKPAQYNLLDQIWLSPGLASKQTGAFIGRRNNKITGDGSDHDPAWVELDL